MRAATLALSLSATLSRSSLAFMLLASAIVLDPQRRLCIRKALSLVQRDALFTGTKPDYILSVPCASILGSPRPCGL